MAKIAQGQTGSLRKNLINAVADAGAECYRICDTVGIGLSDPDAPIPNGIPAKVIAIKKETHMKQSKSMPTTTSATQSETQWRRSRQLTAYRTKYTPAQPILGIGERAGNAETEKVLLNLYLHRSVKKFEGKTQQTQSHS